MRFLHTADLHIGKTVNEFSLQADQQYVLAQMVQAAKEYQVDAFVIAGDVYDRSVPAAEAVELLDSFLTALSKEKIPILMVAGNHDSGKRLMFANEILAQQQVYIAGNAVDGPQCVNIGDTQFVLLPFVRPAEANAQDSDQAVRCLLEKVKENDAGCKKRVLITHCFVTAAGREPELSDSESTVHVGGIDNVDASAFEGFSYVALGHIHKPQQIGGKHIWYAGTPLAYSFSEDSAQKGMNLVELSENGTVNVSRVSLKPLHAMRTVRGSMETLLENGERMRLQKDDSREDYLRVILTDEEELLNPIFTLRSVYPNVMQIILAKNEQPDGNERPDLFLDRKRPGMEELFTSFYELVKGSPMDEKRLAVVTEIAREII